MATANGYFPQVVWNNQRFAVTYRKFVGGKLQVHLAFLDNNTLKMVTPPGEVDLQETNNANSQDNRVVVGPGGQLGVVWASVGTGSQPTTLVFQRVSPAGIKLGKNLTLTTNKISPTIAYNTVDNEYAVVWSGGFTRVSAATGAMVGGVVPFGVAGDPAMVYNTKDKRYAILHGASSGNNLYFAFRDAAGKHVNSSTVYISAPAFKVDTDGGFALAYNATHNEYGVAFRLKPASGGTLYTASLVFMQVNVNGYAPIKATVVSQTEIGLREPALQWNGGAWGLAYTLRGAHKTQALQLSRKGVPVSKTVTMSCPTSATMYYPALAWNGARWAVLWNELPSIDVMVSGWVP